MANYHDLRVIAQRQHGLVARSQLLASGMTSSSVHRLIGQGLLEKVLPGVYRTVGAPTSRHTLLRAALLGLRGAVVSHQSAGELHGLRGVVAERPVVSVPVGRTHSFAEVTVHETTDLTPDQVVEVEAMPTSCPTRVIVELAERYSAPRLMSLIEASIVEGRVVLVELEELAVRLGRRGKSGTVKLRQALEAIGPGVLASTSVLEMKGYQLLERAGLAPAEAQYRPDWLEAIDGCVDFCYPEARLIIEFDGRRWHSRTSDFERDRYRDNLAQVARWRILRFTWDQVINHPAYVVETVRRALAA